MIVSALKKQMSTAWSPAAFGRTSNIKRLTIYRLVVLAVAVASAVLINVEDEYGATSAAAFICFSTSSALELSYLVAVVALVVIVVCNSYSITLLLMTLGSHSMSSSGDMAARSSLSAMLAAASSVGKRTRTTIQRMVLTPIAFAVISLPAVLEYFDSSNSDVWGYMILFFLLLSGPVNFVIWVVMDDDAVSSWAKMQSIDRLSMREYDSWELDRDSASTTDALDLQLTSARNQAETARRTMERIDRSPDASTRKGLWTTTLEDCEAAADGSSNPMQSEG